MRWQSHGFYPGKPMKCHGSFRGRSRKRKIIYVYTPVPYLSRKKRKCVTYDRNIAHFTILLTPKAEQKPQQSRNKFARNHTRVLHRCGDAAPLLRRQPNLFNTFVCLVCDTQRGSLNAPGIHSHPQLDSARHFFFLGNTRIESV